MMRFTFRIKKVLYKQITIEELNDIFDKIKEAERIANAKSIASA